MESNAMLEAYRWKKAGGASSSSSNVSDGHYRPLSAPPSRHLIDATISRDGGSVVDVHSRTSTGSLTPSAAMQSDSTLQERTHDYDSAEGGGRGEDSSPARRVRRRSSIRESFRSKLGSIRRGRGKQRPSVHDRDESVLHVGVDAPKVDQRTPAATDPGLGPSASSLTAGRTRGRETSLSSTSTIGSIQAPTGPSTGDRLSPLSGTMERGSASDREASDEMSQQSTTPSQRIPQAPGLVGISNHSNTCYMNAVVQCLSNTEALCRYFTLDTFKKARTKRPKESISSPHRRSMRRSPRKEIEQPLARTGAVTERLALLLKSMWSNEYEPSMSAKFRQAVGFASDRYRESTQQDAHEFLTWLLDVLDRDLQGEHSRKHNRLSLAPGKRGLFRRHEPSSMPGAVVGASGTGGTGSFIDSLFSGMSVSSLKCPCGNGSQSPDPFMCLSLSLPGSAGVRKVLVTVIYRSPTRRPLQIGILVPKVGESDETNGSVLKVICGRTQLAASNIILCSLDPQSFGLYHQPQDSVDLIGAVLFAFESPFFPMTSTTTMSSTTTFLSSSQPDGSINGRMNGSHGRDRTSSDVFSNTPQPPHGQGPLHEETEAEESAVFAEASIHLAVPKATSTARSVSVESGTSTQQDGTAAVACDYVNSPVRRALQNGNARQHGVSNRDGPTAAAVGSDSLTSPSSNEDGYMNSPPGSHSTQHGGVNGDTSLQPAAAKSYGVNVNSPTSEAKADVGMHNSLAPPTAGVGPTYINSLEAGSTASRYDDGGAAWPPSASPTSPYQNVPLGNAGLAPVTGPSDGGMRVSVLEPELEGDAGGDDRASGDGVLHDSVAYENIRNVAMTAVPEIGNQVTFAAPGVGHGSDVLTTRAPRCSGSGGESESDSAIGSLLDDERAQRRGTAATMTAEYANLPATSPVDVSGKTPPILPCGVISESVDNAAVGPNTESGKWASSAAGAPNGDSRVLGGAKPNLRGLDDRPMDAAAMDQDMQVNPIYVRPAPGPKSVSERETLLLLVMLVEGTGHQGTRFGSPMVLRVFRDIKYTHLHSLIVRHMQRYLDLPVTKKMRTADLFNMRVQGGHPGQSYLTPDDPMPLYSRTVEVALTSLPPGISQHHVRIIAEWTPANRKKLCALAEEIPDVHSSVRDVEDSVRKQVRCTLADCLRKYTQSEQLSGDEAWYCPQCDEKSNGTVKRLCISALPKILVVHIKRFQTVGRNNVKAETMMDFPVDLLDMQPFSELQASPQPRRSSSAGAGRSPFSDRLPKDRSSAKGYVNIEAIERNSGRPSTKYKLISVINHVGKLNRGHYVAMCRSVLTNHWYRFDDSKVVNATQNEIVTKDAFLLFYQRLDFLPSVSPWDWIRQIKTADIDADRGPRRATPDGQPPSPTKAALAASILPQTSPASPSLTSSMGDALDVAALRSPRASIRGDEQAATTDAVDRTLTVTSQSMDRSSTLRATPSDEPPTANRAVSVTVTPPETPESTDGYARPLTPVNSNRRRRLQRPLPTETSV